MLDRNVVDRTGRAGTFDIALRWAVDEHQAAASTADAADAADVPADTPAIFTAIREQLGLKLKPGKAAIPFLVIDSAAKPSAN